MDKDFTKEVMEELEERFKFFTKVGENSWLIQARKDSLMESFHVHTINGHIIMTGDYGGIMANPHCNNEALPNWMAGATTISYFAEKVIYANQNHKCKEFSEKLAEEIIYDIKREIEFKDKEDFNNVMECHNLDEEHGYWELIKDLEGRFDLMDLYEHSPDDYTSRFKIQHKCLILWANKVLDDSFVDKTKEAGK